MLSKPIFIFVLFFPIFGYCPIFSYCQIVLNKYTNILIFQNHIIIFPCYQLSNPYYHSFFFQTRIFHLSRQTLSIFGNLSIYELTLLQMSDRSNASMRSHGSHHSGKSAYDDQTIGEFAKSLDKSPKNSLLNQAIGAAQKSPPGANSGGWVDSHSDEGSERIRREQAARAAAKKARAMALKGLKPKTRRGVTKRLCKKNKSLGSKAKKKAKAKAKKPALANVSPTIPANLPVDSASSLSDPSDHEQPPLAPFNPLSLHSQYIRSINELTEVVKDVRLRQDRIESHIANTAAPTQQSTQHVNAGGSLLAASLAVSSADSLNDKTKQAIWDDKYVDFSSLIEKNETGFTMNFNPSLGMEGITFDPKEKSQITFSDWRKAFNLYHNCYLQKFSPPRYNCSDIQRVSQELLAYDATISDMALRNYDWRSYDRDFRKNRQFNKCPFNQRDIVLYNDAINAPKLRQVNAQLLFAI